MPFFADISAFFKTLVDSAYSGQVVKNIGLAICCPCVQISLTMTFWVDETWIADDRSYSRKCNAGFLISSLPKVIDAFNSYLWANDVMIILLTLLPKAYIFTAMPVYLKKSFRKDDNFLVWFTRDILVSHRWPELYTR